jgi:DNA-binding transcriptional MerR regulator
MKIGQASAMSGISERMIRHYEKIGLMPRAARRDSGYRDVSALGRRQTQLGTSWLRRSC